MKNQIWISRDGCESSVGHPVYIMIKRCYAVCIWLKIVRTKTRGRTVYFLRGESSVFCRVHAQAAAVMR